MFHLLMSLWGARLAEGSTLRTRASDAGWLNGNISKRAVDLVPCLRFVLLRSQISSSFGSLATPFFPRIPFSKTCAIGASKIPYYRYRLSTFLSSGRYAPLRPWCIPLRYAPLRPLRIPLRVGLNSSFV